jgi:pSer/pThr/pTyr-binding forkhead associated (FHA) protein
MARLYVLSGPDLGKSFEIAPGATLGRSTDCAAVLRDHSVSRQHARMELHDGRWSVVDLESRNGLFVGEAKTLRVELQDGAEFKLGEVLCRFRAETAEVPPATKSVVPPPVEDEIVLEEAAESEEPRLEEPQLELPPAPPAARPQAQPPFPKPATPSPELVRTARMQGRGLELRERGVLQYSKVETHGGLLQEELAQQPWYLKLGAWLCALLLFALVAWAAFHATSFFKEKVAGSESPADSPEPR